MPFIPFLLGAVAGTAITYIAKDDSSQEMLKDTGGKITGGAGALTGKVTSMFKKSEDSATEEVAEAADDAKETVAA